MLQACLLRRAVRKAAKKIKLQLSDACGTGQVGPQNANTMLAAAAAMITEMVIDICQAIDVLHKVSLPFKHVLLCPCKSDS